MKSDLKIGTFESDMKVPRTLQSSDITLYCVRYRSYVTYLCPKREEHCPIHRVAALRRQIHFLVKDIGDFDEAEWLNSAITMAEMI